MLFQNIKFDENDVISFSDGNNVYHNPFEVALQAILGVHVLDAYENLDGNLIPRYYRLEDLDDVSEERYAKAALAWLEKNYTTNGEAFLWNYDYDGEYEGNLLTAPWHSAFGQSYVILALLYYYYRDNKYERLLQGAVRGLLLPIDEGGCLLENDDFFWFEEIIGNNLTHIFNAHIVSLIALARVSKYEEFEWVNPYIEKGLKSFYEKMEYMDTGINSAYDMKDQYDCMWQLIPADEGVDVGIRSITLEDRKLELSSLDCFEPREQWIAGIEWSDVDEHGYRRILHGKSIHPIAPAGGERQNTYVYFKNIRKKKDYITVKIEYKVDYDTYLNIYKNCAENGYQALGYVNNVFLQKGKNEITVRIPFVTLATHVSKVYHRFHIQILEELDSLLADFKGKALIKKFVEYEDKMIGGGQKTNIDEVCEITGISVSINEQCGLSCKMCDLGIKNKESSMYYYMKNQEKRQTLEVDILLKRCEELKDNLEVVQFVGTEVTLCPDFPKMVRGLRKLGIQVLATTNGINLRATLRELLDADLNELDISIDGPPDVHDNIRGKKNLFYDIMDVLIENRELIENKQKQGFRLGIGVAITPMNYLYLNDLIYAIKGTPIQLVWCTHMNYITHRIAESHTARYPDYPIGASCTHPEMAPELVNPWLMYKSIRKTRGTAMDYGINFVCVPALSDYYDYQIFYHNPTRAVGKRRCTAPNRTLQINSDGNVCVMSRCYQFELGNIYESSIEDIFYSPKMSEFREKIKKEQWNPCKRCCAIM